MAFWRNIFGLRRSSQAPVDSPRRYWGGSAGSLVNHQTSMEVAAFNRAVIYISTQIAKLPWDVKNKDNSFSPDSPVQKLISMKPNPEMNTMVWRLTMVQSALIKGNAFAEIERNMRGEPIALWPISTDRVDVLRTVEGELIYRVVGGSYQATGTDVYLRARDVYHLRNFHVIDGIMGQSIVGYAMNTLGISIGADRFANGLFANGGRPSGVLSHPGRLSEEAHNRLKQSWAEMNSGRKVGGTAILEEGITYDSISMDPNVMQFLESRKFSVIEIARFFGLPPSKLGDTTAATYSNVEQANLEVATDTLDAWAVMLEMEADDKLLNERFGGKFSELDLYSLFRGDMTTRSNYFSKMMQSSAMSPNEIRAREGMAPTEDGDRYYIAVNNYSPVDRVDEIIDSQISQGDQGNKAGLPSPEDNASKARDVKELHAAVIKYLSDGK